MLKISIAFLVLFLALVSCDEKVPTEKPIEKPRVHPKSDQDPGQDPPEPQTEDAEYKIGSLCNYCSYCKFCKLCDKDCPCESSKTKPNCHLCKYCKYCFLCSTCDVACTPGGILDTISSAIYGSLPSFTQKEKDEVDNDIDEAKDWIKEYL